MQTLDDQRSVGVGWIVFQKRVEVTAAISLQKIPTFAPHFSFKFIVIAHEINWLCLRIFYKKFTRSLPVKIFLAHSLSHAIQRRQHSIERDVDLHVIIECLKKFRYFTIEASKYT